MRNSVRMFSGCNTPLYITFTEQSHPPPAPFTYYLWSHIISKNLTLVRTNDILMDLPRIVRTNNNAAVYCSSVKRLAKMKSHKRTNLRAARG